ncbi:hypothetical protein [Microbispora sp. H10836]|uniref:hypothetical protein n=1 Tax=Microbispora sp. H10836 TaxID=2729106 RepID=UPI001473D69B|nr:hypothetical protein [Microbispora sp. H10836]
MRVEVAVAGAPFGAWSCPQDLATQAGSRDARWLDLPRVSFEVDPATTLGDVLNQAAATLGVTAHIWESEERPVSEWALRPVSEAVHEVAFFRADNADEGREARLITAPILNEEGQVQWGQRVTTVPMGTLEIAAQKDLIKGDPHKIYLFPSSPAGAFDHLDWTQIGVALLAAEKVLARIGGVADGLHALASVWKAGKRTILGLKERLQKRAGTIGDVQDLADTREIWNIQEFSKFVGCSISEAEALLPVLGLSQDSEGRWTRSKDDNPTRANALLITALYAAMYGLAWDDPESSSLAGAFTDVLAALEAGEQITHERVSQIVHDRMDDNVLEDDDEWGSSWEAPL